jgi:ribosomal-protein-alanine N-acetyltransferase
MADPWRIRPARPADAARLAVLERRCFSDPWSARAFEELLHFPFTIAFVAEPAEGLAGYLIARAVAEEGEILNLAVAPDYRRRGLGAQLLERGLAALARAGVRTVWLEVREANTPARLLYQRHGFEAAGRRPAYYRNPVEDALVFRRTLPELRDSGTGALD